MSEPREVLDTNPRQDRSIHFNSIDHHDEYMLASSGFNASSRLNLQHWLWKESLGFCLHPLIPRPSPNYRNPAEVPGDTAQGVAPFCVADIGAGTCLWLIDLARELPSAAQLDGFDIELKQAPPAAWLPENMKMCHFDVFDPNISPDLIERYDVVHVRLFLLVVQRSDPRPILNNIHKLLKPGGWLQWDDLDTFAHRVVKTDDALSTPALSKLCDVVNSEGRHRWVLELGDTLNDQSGYTGARLFRYEDHPALLKANSDQHLMTVAEFAEKLAATNKPDEAKETRRLVHSCYIESLNGAAYTEPRVVCIAQKDP